MGDRNLKVTELRQVAHHMNGFTLHVLKQYYFIVSLLIFIY